MLKRKINELKRISAEKFKKSSKTPIIIVLDNLRSLNNVGSVFRTSDAFLLQAIYLCGITGRPPQKEIQKTALGATETVEWKYFQKTTDAVLSLKSFNYQIVAVEQVHESVLLNHFFPDKKNKYAVIFGNEVTGIDEEVINMADVCIEIPQFGTKHSLNIAVSAGIVIWDMYCKLNCN